VGAAAGGRLACVRLAHISIHLWMAGRPAARHVDLPFLCGTLIPVIHMHTFAARCSKSIILFRCREEIAWTLQTLSANALELSRLWHTAGFGAALLVDVSRPEFSAQLPMQVCVQLRTPSYLLLRPCFFTAFFSGCSFCLHICQSTHCSSR
jgi:hypothetical protein